MRITTIALMLQVAPNGVAPRLMTLACPAVRAATSRFPSSARASQVRIQASGLGFRSIPANRTTQPTPPPATTAALASDR